MSSNDELLSIALEDLARSGLTKNDFKKLGLEILDRDATDEFVGEPRASYRIPYFDIRGKKTAYARVRFLEQARGGKGFKKKKRPNFKYSQPFNSPPHCYFAPYLPWVKIIKDPAQTILITEGEKKAALACKLGIPCIGLGGVYGFQSSKRFWDLVPELADIKWDGRRVEICYDADVMVKSEVRQALHSLAFTLSQQYGSDSIEFIFLDADTAGSKTGLDDYLVAHGAKEFAKIPRQPYRVAAKIQLLNQKVCYVERKGAFYDIINDRFFKSFWNVREAFMNEGEEVIDAKRTSLVIDLWAKSVSRRAVRDVTYAPGVDTEITEHGDFNRWRAPLVRPRRGKPKPWLDLVHHVIRGQANVDWFLRWLAYPVQNPGSKLLSAVFIYGQRQGVGKTFLVDPAMEYIYGEDNFYRMSNESLQSNFNPRAGRSQFMVTNEVYLSDMRDRRSIMGKLKDMITRERVSVNEKYQPEQTMLDHCNYYLTSNHADALVLERGDRRFFVVEAPDEKLDQSVYEELDTWLRDADGAGQVFHYLLNHVDCAGFNPKDNALMTEWKDSLIDLSKDAPAEFGERLIEDPERLFMVNGSMPDLQLYRAEDLLQLFERVYPRYRFTMTVKRMSGFLDDKRLEKRKVRIDQHAAQFVLYAVFKRKDWKNLKNKSWASHYLAHARQYGG